MVVASIHVYVAPLLNLKGETADGVSLTERIQLRPLTDTEKVLLGEQMKPGMRPYEVPLWAGELPFEWALSTRSLWPSRDPMDLLRPQTDFRNAIRCLRLFRPEPVAFPFIAFYPEGGTKLSGSMTFTEFPPSGSLSYWGDAATRPYRMRDENLQTLPVFAEKMFKLIEGENQGSFRVALSRLDGMYQHFQEESQIIDAVIALEAILLKNTEDELSYRLSLRGAHLLGGSEAERVALFDLFRDAYRKRSKIVHGVAGIPAKPSAIEIVDLARQVLKRFIELSGETDHEQLIRRLDLAAVRSDGIS